MPFLVQCPNGCRLKVPRRKAGQVIRCPRCQRLIEVPVPPAEPEAGQIEKGSSTATAAEDDLQEAISRAVDSTPSVSREGLVRRAEQSRHDRVLIARMFAGLLVIIAVVNLGPTAAAWWNWFQEGEPVVWTRWMYLQCLVAALHLVYAVFLVQVPDWSALKVAAGWLLLLAIVFGAASTGLLLGGERGAIVGWLELTPLLVQRAGIWCVAMLCLSVLGSYLAGRESANWKRTEQLLQEILSQRPAGESPS